MQHLKYLSVLLILISHSCTVLEVPSTSKTTKPFFQASPKQSYHLSIGAVLFDQNGRIACHYFKEIMGHKKEFDFNIG